jgi:hypothetical protein
VTNDAGETTNEATHEQLWDACPNAEYLGEWKGGEGADLPDCSCGCAWYHCLEGRAAADWGVCFNPKSPRCGLLTFEHMGCREFEDDGLD